MGQKVNPIIFRIGTVHTWSSRWFAGRDKYKKYLREDVTIRKYLKTTLKESGVAKVDIERSSARIRITIHSAKPGFIIGRGGTGIEDLKKKIKKMFFASEKIDLTVNVVEIKNPNLNAQLIVYLIASALEKRVPFRKACKQAVQKTERAGAKGVKILLSGRLNGVDIARSEKFSAGKVPLHTLRANIDYSRGVARTSYGAIGVKVWVYKGEVFKDKQEEAKNMIKA